MDFIDFLPNWYLFEMKLATKMIWNHHFILIRAFKNIDMIITNKKTIICLRTCIWILTILCWPLWLKFFVYSIINIHCKLNMKERERVGERENEKDELWNISLHTFCQSKSLMDPQHIMLPIYYSWILCMCVLQNDENSYW